MLNLAKYGWARLGTVGDGWGRLETVGTVGDGTGTVGGRDGERRRWDAEKIEIFTVLFNIISRI